MIRLYCGIIKKDSNNNEYVEEFKPFIIAKATQWENFNFQDVVYTQAVVNVNLEDNENFENDVDVKPTNIIKMYRDLFGMEDEDTNLNQLNNTKVNFFTNQTIDSKLNFELRYMYTFGNYGILYFGDFKRNILFKMRPYFKYNTTYNNFDYLSIITNPQYDGDSIENLLKSSRKSEEIYFKNGIHTNYFHSPQHAPFYFFLNDSPHSQNAMESVMTGDFDKGKLSRLNSQCINLTRWSNWNTMLKGTYWYGTPFKIKLLQKVNDIEEIELTTTSSFTQFDDGLAFDTSYELDDVTYNLESRGFSYFTVGTDLTNLFDFTSSQDEIVYLENGYLRKYKDNYGFGLSYVNSDEGIDIFLGNTRDITNNVKFVENAILQGVYLSVPPNFASVAVNYWIKDIDENYDKWEYGNCPIYFSSFGCNGIKTSYVNYDNLTNDDGSLKENVAIPGLVENFSYTSRSYPSNFVTKLLDMSYNFWVNFLSGLGADVPEVNIGGGSLGGGTSGGGGGTGSFDDSSFNITNINDIIKNNQLSTLNSKFLNGYVIDDAVTIASLARQCWNTNFSIQDVANYFGDNVNPMDSLISLKYSPVSLSRGANTNGQIAICGQTISVTGSTGIYALAQDIKQISFGTIVLNEYFGSFVDYDETNISIVLPFVGIQQLNTREVMGGSIGLIGLIDCVLGTITYHLLLQKNGIVNIINTWRGVCFYDFPTSAFDNRGKVDTIMNMTTSAISNGVSGAIGGGIFAGPVGAVAGGAGGVISSVVGGATNYLSQKPSINKNGSFSGDRCGITRPFLIIERPKISLPESYNKLYGYPSNQTTKLKYVTGYTEVGSVHLENMGVATSEEIQEIDSLLKQGVIF